MNHRPIRPLEGQASRPQASAKQDLAITELLHRWSDGDTDGLEDCLPAVYQELEHIASQYMRKERREHTLQTSALVHEAYLKLLGQDRVRWRNREHFFAISSSIMRRLLVDHARQRGSDKRGGGAILMELDEAIVAAEHTDPAILALDEALEELKELDPELSEVIEMRFFAGLENEEIAQVLGVSSRTVIRRWRTARAWLVRFLSPTGEAP